MTPSTLNRVSTLEYLGEFSIDTLAQEQPHPIEEHRVRMSSGSGIAAWIGLQKQYRSLREQLGGGGQAAAAELLDRLWSGVEEMIVQAPVEQLQAPASASPAAARRSSKGRETEDRTRCHFSFLVKDRPGAPSDGKGGPFLSGVSPFAIWDLRFANFARIGLSFSSVSAPT